LTKSEEPTLDEIGPWSEIKLDIVKDYAAAYSRILAAQTIQRFHHSYVDAFAGAGVHISKSSGEFIPGSPTNALNVQPPFREYHFIDLDDRKVASLETIAAKRPDVTVYRGDCNSILLNTVFPGRRYEDYHRVLCLLDPYGLHLDWRVVATAGAMRSVEIFLNFPIADINRNVLRHDLGAVEPDQAARLTRFWGDESWRDVAYRESKQASLWGGRAEEKVTNEELASAFRIRLQKVAGFKHVPAPMAMRNTKGAIVYYLYFASQKPVAEDIVQDIFKKHGTRGRR
jgi:three-Cys-motif partner protein